MAKLFKFVKGGLLVVMLAAVVIGGIRFMGHHEREAGHAVYQVGNVQRGEYRAHQAGSVYPSAVQSDYRDGVRGNDVYQGEEHYSQWGNSHGVRRGLEWRAFALIPLIGAVLIIILGCTLVRKANARYLKWIGGLLLVIMLWPVALTALVIYAGWKLLNKNCRADNLAEAFLVNQDLQAGTYKQMHLNAASADFLDEWEQRTKSKRRQEDSE